MPQVIPSWAAALGFRGSKMGDTIDVGATIPLAYGKDPQQSALAGQQISEGALDLNQRQSALSALRGVDLNDPNSIGNTVQGLVRAGALDQGSAISNLAWQRQLRADLPGFESRLVSALSGRGAPTGTSSLSGLNPSTYVGAAPQSPPQAPPPQVQSPEPTDAGPHDQANVSQGPAPTDTPAPPPTPDELAHVQQTLLMGKQAADSLLAMPLAQRPAAFAQIKQAAIARGVPEEAVDAAGQDLSDQGLQSLSTYYGAHAAHIGTLLPGGQQAPAGVSPQGAGGAPAPAQPTAVAGGPQAVAQPEPTQEASADAGDGQPQPQPQAPQLPSHPSTQWATNLLSNPAIIAEIARYKAAGFDMSGILETAKAVAQPEIAKEAEEAHAGGIAAAQEGAKAGFDVIHTTIHGVPVDMSRGDFLRLQASGAPGVGVGLTDEEKARQTAAGTAEGELPYAGPLAKAKAGGTAAGEAPYQFEDVPQMDANGQPTGRTVRVSKAQEHGAITSGGSAGVAQSPAEAEFAKGEAATLGKTVATSADPQELARLQAKSQNAQTIIKLANQVKSGKFTGDLSEAAQVLSSLGVPSSQLKKFGSDTSILEQALNKDVLGAFQNTKNVRNVREFNLILSTVGHINDPADKLRYEAGLSAALANQQRQYGQFASAYAAAPGTTKSQAALDQAWTAAHGNESVFADPVWKGVTLYGKPAVIMDKKPGPDGHVWGWFGYGTPLQQPFLVK